VILVAIAAAVGFTLGSAASVGVIYLAVQSVARERVR
jgi:hypothetical protein